MARRSSFVRPAGRSASIVAHKEWFNICDLITDVDLAPGTAALGAIGIQFSIAATILRQRGHVFLQLDTGAADERAMMFERTKYLESSA